MQEGQPNSTDLSTTSPRENEQLVPSTDTSPVIEPIQGGSGDSQTYVRVEHPDTEQCPEPKIGFGATIEMLVVYQRELQELTGLTKLLHPYNP